jgi:hypothetical protein
MSAGRRLMKAARVKLDTLATLLKADPCAIREGGEPRKNNFSSAVASNARVTAASPEALGECAFGGTKPPATVSQITVCCQKTAEFCR